MRKNKVTTESSDKALRRRKVVPFYHELDDSLCSSLTEYTQNTEGSQCFDVPSDMDESIDSDEIPNSRSSKRRRLESDEENDNESNSTTKRRALIKEHIPDINADENEENDDQDENNEDHDENNEDHDENNIDLDENSNSNSNSNINIENLEEIFAEEDEYR